MEDLLTSGEQYAYILLKKWEEIIDLSEQFRTNLQMKESDHYTTFLYISKLTRLWGELYPKVRGRHDLNELEAEFDKFRPYYYDPVQLAEPDKSEEIFKLEATLREALEQLKVLRWEK